MKTLRALLVSVLLVTVGRAQTAATGTAAEEPKTPVVKPTPPPTVRIPPPTTTKAATEKTAPKKTDGVKKAEPPKKEEPKIEGVEVPRGEKGFLGVQIVNGAFKISFYDAKKKPAAVDVARAVLRWDPKYKVGQERVVLNVDSDGKSLSSPKPIRPPYNFKLFITLIKEATEKEDNVGETYVIDFRA